MFEQNMITQIMWRVEVKIASHIVPSKLRKLHTICYNQYLCSRHLLEKKNRSLQHWNVNFETVTVLF